MKSFATSRFWELYEGLPKNIRALADKNYGLWRKNPQHPSLHFKRIKGNSTLYSVRIGDSYRALGNISGDEIVWVWIGSHESYNKLIAKK